MNSDCNLTAGLEAVMQVAEWARVMLRRKIDVSSGLVNGAVGTVIAIKAHHITVQFDRRPQPHDAKRVKSKFMPMKRVYVYHLLSLCTSAWVCRWTVQSWTCRSRFLSW